MDQDKFEVSLSKRDKLTYAIYMKCKIYCLNNLTLDNLMVVTAKVMHEVNKESNLLGVSKQNITKKIVLLLVDDFGEDWMQEMINEEFIDNLIENIYRSNLHRAKGKSNCIIM